MPKKILFKGIVILAVIAVLISTMANTSFPAVLHLPSPEAENPLNTGTGEKLNMSYIYFGSPSTYTASVERTQDSLDIVSPSYFDLNADGSLKLTPAAEKSFADEMHTKGIKVVPFLSNHWDRALGQAALNNRAALAAELAEAVRSYDLDGINVDLENLTPAECAAYTDFVRLLRELLADKLVTVAVASNPWETTSGWAGSYDYAGLAKYSDYLMVMAYDEHCQSGSAGSIAGISFVERSLQYALGHVPKEKIMLGMAFYGRIWKDGGGDPQGYGLSNLKVAELIAQYGGSVSFDSASQSPYAVITIRASDQKPVVGGNPLSAGTYTIWFENEASIKQKLKLVNKYDLLGTGSWSLGQETADTWNYYKLWLSGCYFEDIQTHWAKDSILLSYQTGWVNGMSPSEFSPDGVLTRAQAAVILVRALELSSSNVGISFDDTIGHWAQAEIEAARQAGLIGGIGNNLFSPDAPMTREQMAVLLHNMEQLRSAAGGDGAAFPFTDISAEGNPWSYEAIEAMSGNGILLGFPDGSFRPDQPLLRAQMTALMERLAVGYDTF